MNHLSKITASSGFAALWNVPGRHHLYPCSYLNSYIRWKQGPLQQNNIVCHTSTSSTKTKKPRRRLNLANIPNISEFVTPEQDGGEVRCVDGVENPPYVRTDFSDLSVFPHKGTVYFETYGCQMNVNDSEYAWAILKNTGYTKVAEKEKADVIMLVTCSIREKAEEKIWQRLRQLKALKHKSKNHEFPKLCVLGCMAERLKSQIFESENAVDIIAGPDAYRDLPRLLHHATNKSTSAINTMLSVDETYADIMPVRFDTQSKTAFVSIMRGCDNMCSYCIVPFTRGRERSRPVHSIVEEVKMLSDQGIKQVTLLGQNVNSYRDLSQETFVNNTPSSLSKGFGSIYKPKLGGLRFADLLDEVAQVDKDMRIRFTSPHPKDFPDEVLQAIADNANICNQIHLPAQSGSSNVLKSMRRGHTIEDYYELVERIRHFLPDVSISTDMISGFCGETEADHAASVKLMNEIKYNFGFLFKYSMRKKTHAYHKMKDDVPEDVKQQRLVEVIDAYNANLRAANEKYVGETQLVLIEKLSPRSSSHWLCRNDAMIRVIIPCGALPTSEDVGSSRTETKPGDYVAVKLDSYHPNTYHATPLFISSISEFASAQNVPILARSA